jgi:hypothetical protein
MTTAYPGSFPCASRIEGHSAQMAAALVRTPFEAGNSRQRRTHRVLPQQIELVFVIEQALYASWLAWVNAHAWDEWVTMRLPGLLAGAAGTDTAATPVRFCTDLQAELVALHRRWIWRVRVSAEYLPLAGDFPLINGVWIIGGKPATPSADDVIAGTPGAPAPIFTNPGTPHAPVAIL